MLTYRVLTGPTASGKTDWLLRRARTVPLAIISADSRQVYEHMDIGTGKSPFEVLWNIPHFGVDCIRPNESYSAFQFVQMANAAFWEALNMPGAEVWVCGGTGLYIRALVDRLPLGPPPRWRLRKALWPLIEKLGSQKVAADLALDMVEAKNPVRVLRKAEILASTETARVYGYAGLGADAVETDAINNDGYDSWIKIREDWQCAGTYALDPGSMLEARIATRVRGMFSGGLLDEVRNLRKLGFGDCEIVKEGIAYREAGLLLDGELSEADAIQRAIIRTRQYAKRQRTFFRGRGWPTYKLQELNDAVPLP